MLFPVADLAMPFGPPPQGIIEKKWLWHLLLVLLSLCFILRFIGLDIPGALLSGLMLCFAVIMTRDGMHEILRYALVFSVLCFLNFFFDLLPLMTELGGRVKSRTVPISTVHNGGTKQTEYKMVVTSRPFFDGSEGFIYNVQSLAMILSPITMALGCYLAVSAHIEAQRAMPDFWETDFREDGLGPVNAGGGMLARGGAFNAALQPSMPRAGSEPSMPRAGSSPQIFRGPSYKLEADPPASPERG